ncbi:MAG: alpha-E domain-containing protein [Rikenellaceae bacterium]
MVCNVITADKANRLFWLGRYAERVYMSMHLLRYYYDKVIDGDIANLKEYYNCLGVNTIGQDEESEAFQISQLYDHSNICSIASSIDGANDNCIFLRRDIKSESLSYIQMARTVIDEHRANNEKNITLLQPVTDYMLAFFGSIDERVFDERIRNFLKVGRFVENIDLHIRFHYPFFRVEEVFLSLKEAIKRSGAIIDNVALQNLDELLTEDNYRPKDEVYRARVLGYLNRMVMI